ncbi:MAG TPA: hypothetical protein VMB34_27025 [Acetobacteraceae bacterium]|nr:hypothetical protein [Acetobacteraceae bacterium]
MPTDIAGFCDAVSHAWPLKFAPHRIGDRRLIRLIRKWLQAAAMEAGTVKAGTVGTPRGAVVSAALVNIFPPCVFDLSANQSR